MRKTLSLFTGAGGLDLGLEAAGFKTVGCVEIDKDARNTLQLNRPKWGLLQDGDIFANSPEEMLAELAIKRRELTLLCGGPPCQPFSKSGQWAKSGSLGLKDPRAKTLEAYLAILEHALPEIFLMENVKGVFGSGRSDVLKLFNKRIRQINKRNNVRYELRMFGLNAADFGVPQHRERMFLVAHRRGKKFKAPVATHGPNGPGLLPWATAWDAIGDLDKPEWEDSLNPSGKWGGLLASIPEGHNYLWHTPRGGGEPLFGWRTKFWTFLLKLAKDKPSWTLQASPGPATGPFHWRNRRLSIEELCRIQTFPQDYRIAGTYISARKQIGNAVPSALAEILGVELRRQFLNESVRKPLMLLPKRRDDCPSPAPLKSVPKRYTPLRSNHAAHPGTGLGPQPRT